MIDKPLMGEDTYLNPLFADGLVGCWLMNEGSGDTVSDLSGNGLHGTFAADTIWTAGKFGHAVQMDGTADAIIVSPHAVIDAIGANMSISMWCLTDEAPASVPNWHREFWYFNVSSTERILARYDDNGQLSLYNDIDNSNTEEQLFSCTITENVWNHYVWTLDASTVTVYKNGVFADSDALVCSFANLDDGATLYIGGDPSVTTRHWSGNIDNVALWNRTLSAFEAGLLYREPFWGFRKNEVGIYHL